MDAAPVLAYLKKHGQLTDREIAAATGLSLPKVRASLAGLEARGEITSCRVTRFAEGKPVQGLLCRVSGYVPPKTPGRKPGT